MKTHHRGWAAALFALVAATGALGYTTFVWVGDGSNTAWTYCNNWEPVVPVGDPEPPECYPSDSTEEARIPYLSGGWDDITISDFQAIGKLLVKGSVAFDATNSPSVLYAQDAVFNAVSIPSGQYLTITLENGAEILTY